MALVIGFFPWILAYTATRVMYGIEEVSTDIHTAHT